jgi:hypothetical protein
VLGWFVGEGGRKCAAAVAYEAIFEEPFPQDYTTTDRLMELQWNPA